MPALQSLRLYPLSNSPARRGLLLLGHFLPFTVRLVYWAKVKYPDLFRRAGSGTRRLGASKERPGIARRVSDRVRKVMSARGRFCCISPLPAFANSDSVAVKVVCGESDNDGTGQPGPRSTVLFVLSRRGCA